MAAALQSFDAMALAALPPQHRERLIRSLSRAELNALQYSWEFWSRPEQREPDGEWRTWLLLAGRGGGKTRTAAETVRKKVKEGKARRIALVGRTVADVREVMIEGSSGILAVSPPSERPHYEPSKRRLTWPNGAIGTTYSADVPDLLRGPEHDFAWADELAAWANPEAWSNLEFGLRIGDPRVIVSTTPRPTTIIRQIIADATTRVTRWSTYANRANLAGAWLAKTLTKYEGTRLGRQELHADVLSDAPGALWKLDQIDQLRIRWPSVVDKTTGLFRLATPLEIIQILKLRVVVIAVDPAVTSGEDANETGIIVAGLGEDGHGYVLEDLSGQWTPGEWGAKVVDAYIRWDANRVVAEVNQGGDLVESNVLTALRDAREAGKKGTDGLKVTKVHAAKGKRTRAEPIAALDEQKKIHHVGVYAKLEDQMTTWEPDLVTGLGPKKKILHSDSPDRVDARVWAFTDLMIDRNPAPKSGYRGGVIQPVPWEDRTIG